MACRICFEESDECDLISPCACDGTIKYAHQKCIQRWYAVKRVSMYRPGVVKCEICNTAYSVTNEEEVGINLYNELFAYSLSVAMGLSIAYLTAACFLWIVYEVDLFIRIGSNVESALVNGIIFVHVTLGMIYTGTFMLLPFISWCKFPFAIYCGDNNYEQSGICVAFYFIVGVIATMLIFYMDISTKITNRYHNVTIINRRIDA